MRLRMILKQGGLLLVLVIWLLPLYWMLLASLRLPGTPPAPTIAWLPQHPSLNSYAQAAAIVPLWTFLGNSLLIMGITVPLTIVSASWAALGIMYVRPSRRIWVLGILIGCLLIPGQMVWLPRFILFAKLKLIDSYWPLILPAFMGSSPLFVLLFYWAMRRIEPETLEAASLDGAQTLQIWATIVMPQVIPTTVTVIVLTTVLYWSDFITPLMYLKSESRYPLSVGLSILQQVDRANWPILMAGAVMMTLPLILGFLLIQRLFWRSMLDSH